jgi:hypothetical protein
MENRQFEPGYLSLPGRAVVRFYNKRGTAEQWTKEGKQAVAAQPRVLCFDFVFR